MAQPALIPDLLKVSAESFPDREATRDARGGRMYADLLAGIDAYARALVGAGLTAGGRCLIAMPNSVDLLVAHFAVLEAGGVSVPCEAALSEMTLEAVYSGCTPEFVILDTKNRDRLAPALARLGAKVILAGEPAESWSGGAGGNPHARKTDDLACLMYTTGATGQPKGVMLTHANVLAAISNICDFIGYTPEDREVITLPLSHNFGMGHAYCNLARGGAVYLEHGLIKVGRVLNALEDFGATGFPGTPLGYAMLLDRYGAVLAEKGKNLRFIVVNSAPLPPERTQQLRALLPDTDIMVYYGLTEASRSTFLSLSKAGPSHYRSVGKPMRGVDLRIVDAKGDPLPAGEEGQVVIRGATLTPGYWNSPQETAQAIRGGWLQTGDLAALDTEGNLFLKGRLKDVVNVGGYKVNPAEVEAALAKFPGIGEVAVAGLMGIDGDPEESLVAAIVLSQPDARPDPTQLQAFCSKSLERYKHPSRYFFVDRIPRSDTGKIKRHELVAQLTALTRSPEATC